MLGPRAVFFADVHVEDGRAGVVAVDRLLDMLFHRERNILGEIVGVPFGAVGGDRDDQFVLRFGKQAVVEELHIFSPYDGQKGRSPTMPARSMRRTVGG